MPAPPSAFDEELCVFHVVDEARESVVDEARESVVDEATSP